MRIFADYRTQLATVGVLMSFGLNMLLGQILPGDSIWLLAFLPAFLPAFSFETAFLIIVFVTLTGRTGKPLTGRIIAGAAGSIVGAALVLFAADPVVHVLGLPRWPSAYAHRLVSASVALAILALGVVLLVRVARAMRTEPAAA